MTDLGNISPLYDTQYDNIRIDNVQINDAQNGKYAIQCLKVNSNRFNFLNSKNLIIGRIATGKTNLALSILLQIKEHICDLYYFSNKIDEFYENVIYDINDDFNGVRLYGPKDLPKLKSIIENIKIKKRQAQIENKPYHACIILDDVIYADKLFFSTDIGMNLMFNGNSYGITLIITMGYPTNMSPMIRTQFKYIMMAGEINRVHSKKLYKYFGGMFPSYDSFRENCELTHRFEFMTIFQHEYKSSFEDKFAWVVNKKLNLNIIIKTIKNLMNISFMDNNVNDDIKTDIQSEFLDNIRKEIITQQESLSEYLSNKQKKRCFVSSNQSINLPDLSCVSHDDYVPRNDTEISRLQKIDEIKYITSMISYLNSRLNSLAEELKNI